ncbi:T9SS type A sorting domain-containing protein [Flavobacterium beibuense]|nr:T9SS type A sorting domain-containing protein [Flavobacterium beibuense]
MKQLLLTASLVCASIMANAQCDPTATLSENFNTFENLPQNCWSAITDGPMVYIDGEEGENFVTFYASTFVDTDAYLITPELNTLNGNYELSFDTQRIVMGPPPAPGTVTIQLGTLTDNTDADTFVAFGEPITVTDDYTTHSNIAITAAEGTYIAFKISGDTAHNAAFIDNVVWSEIPSTCEAADTLDENFNEFVITGAATDFPQNCWSKLTTNTMVYLDGEEGEIAATFYTGMSINEAGYLITPAISTIDGNHKLSFDAAKLTEANVTVQIGTMTDPADAETFTAFGDVITLSADVTTYSDIVINATEDTYIAFQFMADAVHNAAILDNVKWEINCEAQAGLEEGFEDFIVAGPTASFPQNCWSSLTDGTFVYIDQDEETENKFVTYYSMMSTNSPGYLISPSIVATQDAYGVTFDSYKEGAGNVTVQLGTMTNPADTETFTALGEPIALTEENQNYTVEFAQGSFDEQKHLVFMVNADTAHHAAFIDNVMFTNLLGNDDFNLSTTNFSLYPNPSSDKNVTVNFSTQNTDANQANITVYSITGSMVYNTVITNGQPQQINLSALNSGLYLVKVQAGNYTDTKKLIIK